MQKNCKIQKTLDFITAERSEYRVQKQSAEKEEENCRKK